MTTQKNHCMYPLNVFIYFGLYPSRNSYCSNSFLTEWCNILFFFLSFFKIVQLYEIHLKSVTNFLVLNIWLACSRRICLQVMNVEFALKKTKFHIMHCCLLPSNNYSLIECQIETNANQGFAWQLIYIAYLYW